MLTASADDRDRVRSQALEVSGYIPKSGSMSALVEIMKGIG